MFLTHTYLIGSFPPLQLGCHTENFPYKSLTYNSMNYFTCNKLAESGFLLLVFDTGEQQPLSLAAELPTAPENR